MVTNPSLRKSLTSLAIVCAIALPWGCTVEKLREEKREKAASAMYLQTYSPETTKIAISTSLREYFLEGRKYIWDITHQENSFRDAGYAIKPEEDTFFLNVMGFPGRRTQFTKL